MGVSEKMQLKTLMNSLTVGCLIGSIAGMTMPVAASDDTPFVRGAGTTPHSGIDGPVPNPTPEVDAERLKARDKRRGCGKGHLEPRLGQAFWPDRQQNKGGKCDGPKCYRRAVQQNRQQHHGNHHKRSLCRDIGA